MNNQIGDAEEILKKSSLKDIVSLAFRSHIIIPAFNIPYLPMVKPVVSALKATASFGLIEVAVLEIKRFKSISFRAVKQEYDNRSI